MFKGQQSKVFNLLRLPVERYDYVVAKMGTRRIKYIRTKRKLMPDQRRDMLIVADRLGTAGRLMLIGEGTSKILDAVRE